MKENPDFLMEYYSYAYFYHVAALENITRAAQDIDWSAVRFFAGTVILIRNVSFKCYFGQEA